MAFVGNMEQATERKSARTRRCYLPSPEEIQLACQAIRAGWTDEERARRGRGATERTAHGVQPAYRLAEVQLELPDFEPESVAIN